MAKKKKYSVFFKVPGFKDLRVDYIEAATVREALDIFEATRSCAVVQSIG